PETLIALYELLDQRIKGAQLDDRRLTEAFVVLFDREAMAPHKYAQFGDYLLHHTDETELARQAFANAVLLSRQGGDEAYARWVLDAPAQSGHHRMAAEISKLVEEVGGLGEASGKAR